MDRDRNPAQSKMGTKTGPVPSNENNLYLQDDMEQLTPYKGRLIYGDYE